MRLSLFSDYSLRVLMFAAARGDSFAIQDVADSYGISKNHLVKVVNQLAHSGHLATRRGRGGGITLGRPAEEIRLGDLVRVTEGKSLLVECMDAATNTCPINGNCYLKHLLHGAMEAFYGELNRHTLADLVSGRRGRAILATLSLVPP
jgi:Rrf2 family nitric oxide-sensitive transcriptional repressor